MEQRGEADGDTVSRGGKAGREGGRGGHLVDWRDAMSQDSLSAKGFLTLGRSVLGLSPNYPYIVSQYLPAT